MTKDITSTPLKADIRTIIDRYMSGETTNEEEVTLRTWFRLAGDDVPEEWLPIRAMLSFVDEERDLLGNEVSAQHSLADNTTPSAAEEPANRDNSWLRSLHKPRIWTATAVAAAAIAIMLVVPVVNRSFGHEPQNYAVIDGKVYTSPQVIKQQVDDALQTVSTEDEDPFGALDMMQ